MKRRVAICGGREAVADFVQGGQIDPPPPPVKIGLNYFVLLFYSEQSMVQMLCFLLECLLTPDNTPPDCPKELYELYFVFASIWAFGGSMFQDQVCKLPFLVVMEIEAV